jgi:diacylglycerol kinase family enzyme
MSDLKTVLVVNPHAGHGRGRRILPEVLAALLRLRVLPGELAVRA